MQDRYQTFEDLYLYCYRVAGTVGLMTLPILGAAEGYTEEQAAEPAIALGIALQLTNILRDVGEDLERGRIYLPLDELAAFGLTEDDLFRCEVRIRRAYEYLPTPLSTSLSRPLSTTSSAARYTYAVPHLPQPLPRA